MSSLSFDYVNKIGKYLDSYPLVPLVLVVNATDQEPIESLVDTGFEGDVLISKEKADAIGLPEDRLISDKPSNITLANRQKVPSNIYDLEVKIGTKIIPVTMVVPTVNVPMLWDGFVGREILDLYDVTFKGKTNPRKLIIED